MVHDAIALGVGEELVAEADQATSRNLEFHAQIACHLGHVLQLSLAQAQALHNCAHIILGHVNGQCLHGLLQSAGLVAMHNNLRLANLQLKALTAHGFNQNGQMQLAAAGHLISIGAIGFLNAQSHVGFCLFIQTVTDVTAGYEFALLASKGAVVYIKYHGQSGLVNFDALQRLRIILVSDGFTDFSILQAHQGHDVAGLGLVHLNALQALISIKTADFAHAHLVLIHQGHGFTIVDGAAHHATDNNAADEIVIIQSVDQHLQRCLGINIGSRNIFQNNLEQGLQIIAFVIHAQLSDAVTGGSIDNGEFQLILISIQLDEEVQHLVHNLLHALVGTVDFIDNHDGLQMCLQGLAQHVFGLGHRALIGINQKQHAINHVQHALHLAAKIGMARGIQNINLHAIMHNSGIFGQNSNATLTLQIVGVHNALFHMLVSTEHAALLQHRINQGGLAMVNVGNNGYITNIVSNHGPILSSLLINKII